MPRPHTLISGNRRSGSATGANAGLKKYQTIDDLGVALVEQAHEQTEKAPLNIQFMESILSPNAFIQSYLDPQQLDKKIVKPLISSGQWKHPGAQTKLPLISPDSGRVPFDGGNSQATIPDSYYLYQNSSQQWILLYTDSANKQLEVYLSQLMDPQDIPKLDEHVDEFKTLLAAQEKPERLNQNPVGNAIRHFRNNTQKIMEFECRKYKTDPNVVEFIHRTPNQNPTKIFTYNVTLENGQAKFETKPSHPNELEHEMQARIRGFLECVKENQIKSGSPEPITLNLTGDAKFRELAEKISPQLKIKVLNPMKDEANKDKDKDTEKKDEEKTEENDKPESSENIIRTVKKTR